MNITHTNGLVAQIKIYNKEGQTCAIAQYMGVSGVAISNEYIFDFSELVNEALKDFCLNWKRKHKNSDIMSNTWIVASPEPEEYVAISL